MGFLPEFAPPGRRHRAWPGRFGGGRAACIAVDPKASLGGCLSADFWRGDDWRHDAHHRRAGAPFCLWREAFPGVSSAAGPGGGPVERRIRSFSPLSNRFRRRPPHQIDRSRQRLSLSDEWVLNQNPCSMSRIQTEPPDNFLKTTITEDKSDF